MGYLLYGAADSTVAKVGIDLDQEVAAHNGGFQLCVALVGGDDGSPPRHLHTMVAFFKFPFLIIFIKNKQKTKKNTHTFMFKL
jgi:hypothetical protein